ncbi:hypothetical protein KIPB_004524 [Kipferlia bialata]|uniref:Uncharacterized protein n=1 Tax=Kipferlia bialata TaxID=797122 RepID=A0A9K3GHI4_9EUKA|nr:hypothetical protein KIPB_004524 [Kipferlia bialata]|eukprot:g4524.t1
MNIAIVLGVILLFSGVLADNCRYTAGNPYLSSDVSLCLRDAFDSDSYEAYDLIESAIAAANQYLLIDTTLNSGVIQGLEALKETYNVGVSPPESVLGALPTLFRWSSAVATAGVTAPTPLVHSLHARILSLTSAGVAAQSGVEDGVRVAKKAMTAAAQGPYPSEMASAALSLSLLQLSLTVPEAAPLDGAPCISCLQANEESGKIVAEAGLLAVCHYLSVGNIRDASAVRGAMHTQISGTEAEAEETEGERLTAEVVGDRLIAAFQTDGVSKLVQLIKLREKATLTPEMIELLATGVSLIEGLGGDEDQDMD